MENFFKYLVHNAENEDWGFYLHVAGYADIKPGCEYPPKGHPIGYSFSWEKGRVLNEFQLNYITEGEGTIETLDGIFQVKKGSFILIRPGMWHRYKPVSESGWYENYIGFNGSYAQHIFNQYFFSLEKPVIHIGFHEKIIDAFLQVIDYIKDEKPGYQQICSGQVIYILGMIYSIKKNENFTNKNLEEIIQKACFMIRSNLSSNLYVENLAAELNTGYSQFRKMFKKYIGMSPAQYHLFLRIQQAKYLLSNRELPIKDIAGSLGFCSIYHFSKLFKEKTGVTPGKYARQVQFQALLGTQERF
ncbi:MAG: AraC family transcriptional regulator [Bacteroidales bacterium]